VREMGWNSASMPWIFCDSLAKRVEEYAGILKFSIGLICAANDTVPRIRIQESVGGR